jgi:hypothetical protein
MSRSYAQVAGFELVKAMGSAEGMSDAQAGAGWDGGAAAH